MWEAKKTLKISEKSLYKTLTNFMVIWFLVLLFFYVLASFSTFTFIFTMSPLGGFSFSLIFAYYAEGFIITSFLLFSRHFLKEYKKYWSLEGWTRFQLYLAVPSLIFYFIYAILGLYFIFGTIYSNLSSYQSLPVADIANQGVADIFIDFMLLAAFIVIMGVSVIAFLPCFEDSVWAFLGL